MDPISIQLWLLDNGRWSWEVEFPDRGLDQDGYATSYAEARRGMEAAIENAQGEPDPRIATSADPFGDDEIDTHLPNEGAVE